MDRILVKGGTPLEGEIVISGAKNACLALMPAALLTTEPLTLTNSPFLSDIVMMKKLLSSLGCEVADVQSRRIITITAGNISNCTAKYDIVRKMRASILVLGPLLAREGRAIVSLPGGCAIGARPVDLHLNSLKKMGAKIKIKNGYIIASAKKGLKGCVIKFPKISVGATENLIIAASYAKGETILSNCAIEPEICDLINFLNKMGCKISWLSKRTIKIIGVKYITDTKYSVMFDRIEAGTYLIAAAITEGNIRIKNIIPKIIETEMKILKKIGAKIKIFENEINVIGNKKIKSININTAPYPGFPTDLQAQIMVLLCKADKKSLIKENIFENRFMHVAELRRLGAKILIKKNKAIIEGKTKFEGAELMSSDLRASVALVLAAIVANGVSVINRIYHLDRGYENIEKKLSKLGVNIRRIY